jgi:hypothetical protein
MYCDDNPILEQYECVDASELFVDWILCEKMQRTQDDNINNESVIQSSSRWNRHLFPRDYLYESEVFPIQIKPLSALPNGETINLCVPNNLEANLDRAYGKPDNPKFWRDCYLASSHRNVTLELHPCQLCKEQVKMLFGKV